MDGAFAVTLAPGLCSECKALRNLPWESFGPDCHLGSDALFLKTETLQPAAEGALCIVAIA